MAGQPEVMRYELDITDVQAKAARIQDLLGKIASGRARGVATDELERQLENEFNALAKSTGKTKEAQSSIEQLIKQKEKLGSVIAILGGQFGGFVGQLGNVAELFINLGRAAVLPAAVIAGVTLLAKLWHDASEEARKAREEQDKLAAAEERRRQAGRNAQASIAEKAREFGVAGISQAAAERSRELQERGLVAEFADFQAILEAMGYAPDDAAAAMRGKMVGGDAALGRSANERDRKIRELIRLGSRPESLRFEEAFRTDTGDTARRGSYQQKITDADETVTLYQIRQFLAAKGISGADARYLTEMISQNKAFTAPNTSAHQLDVSTPAGRMDRLREEFYSERWNRQEVIEEPRPVIVNIQTQYNGAGSVYADATSSVAQRSPGSTNGARAITP